MSNCNLGPVILDIEGLRLTREEAERLKSPAVGGLILFTRNFESVQQLTALLADVRAVRSDIIVAVDQEGGRVQRFREEFTRIPPMQQLGRACSDCREAGLELTRDCGWLMASELLSVGVDMSFAPVLDLDESYSRVIGDRSFGADADLVINAARAFLAGMHEAGMATTGKHFPGHGSVQADSHFELPVDDRPFEAVAAHDLRPFAALVSELDAVMPAHLLFPEVDDELVGFSPYWLQNVLRSQLGFNGVIFSDDLSMAGASAAGGYTERADRALAAGCDAVLVCNSPVDAAAVIAHVERAYRSGSGRLAAMRAQVAPEEAQARLTTTRYIETKAKLAHLWNK
jgi:beta-N-acetylhexosaminidase